MVGGRKYHHDDGSRPTCYERASNPLIARLHGGDDAA
jgi:hypothetical protein